MPTARSDGFGVHYEVSGEGPLLVLHPGMFQTGASWGDAGYTAALAADHTVVALDPLGLGASDAPHATAAYALERRVDAVTAVLDDLGADRATVWGYSMGALTALGMARHAPERCDRIVAGSWDPVNGFASGLEHALRQLELPADTDAFDLLRQGAAADPAQAAVIDAADGAALRANYEAFSRDRDLDAGLASTGVPMLMYCGTADPWHEPMRGVAARVGATFFSVPDADHLAGWVRSADVLPEVRRFLARR
ncbi:alpha/beta fold hydrolase [Streptomyces sp. 3MP-14]|uniref:Alpha/beta fold hydrolase n=1 Tax=Streptomyces mimosae TaxID=2586635 RepID=A0A5N5ZWT8_9ACTN|nr:MULTISPECIES: alpha/beta fold hydrolase [Streptomyces]KAB8160196.1 alpha/beta fold hydrolase [Streptomyces mimosae]KAB8176635.1 alpha/beta fold hydrolase [Streptomyces sp. 3MP-14]